MEDEERKIAKVYAAITLYTIILLAGGILLGFAMGRQSVISPEREIQQSDTLQVESVNRSLMTEDNIIERDLLNHTEEL